MRILFVSFSNSIHVARWISQISDQGWDIHLFPSGEHEIHPELKNLTVHDFKTQPASLERSVRLARAWRVPGCTGRGHRLLERIIRGEWLARFEGGRDKRLARLIRRLRPDLVHSQEIQHGGYLALEAKKRLGGWFPPWIVTNWGSDIFFFGRIPEHASRIRAVLEACDYYSCECHRDVDLGRAFGFKGEVLPILPNTGGFDLERVRHFRQPGATSTRRLILLKGYQGWVYRALVGLAALELCADVLNGFRVGIYLASHEVKQAAEKLSHSTGIPIDVFPFSPHEEILRLHGRARISIGLSIADAISTSFLEALVMGSFPIQSSTACASEWVRNGETGLIVPPEDPQAIAAAIRRAVTDDALVDRAAEQNARVVEERLDQRIIRQEIVQMYARLATQAK
jgi:glycosyltransferase involved in cell wall biosynthesis